MTEEGPSMQAYVHSSGDLFFVTNLITPCEEDQLLRGLYGSDYKQNHEQHISGDGGRGELTLAPPPRLPWVQLSRRRLLNLGGVPGTAKASVDPSGGGGGLPKMSPMISESIPSWVIDPVGKRLLAVSDEMEKIKREQEQQQKQEKNDKEGAEGIAACEVHAESPHRKVAVSRSNNGALTCCLGTTAEGAKEVSGVLVELLNACGEGASKTPRPTPLYRCVCTAGINHVLVNEYIRPNGILGHEDGPAYEPIVSIVSLESSVMLRFESKRLRRARAEAAEKLRISAACGSTAHEHAMQKNDDSRPLAIAVEELTDDIVEVFLPSRSLVVFRGRFYTDYLHEVPEAETDTYSASRCFNFEEVLSTATAAASGECPPAEYQLATIARGHRRVSLTYRRVLNVAKLSAASLFGRSR